MTSEVEEAVQTLKGLLEHFNPEQIGAPNPNQKLTTDQLIEAREAIGQLKDERNTIAEWHAKLQAADLDGIAAMFNDKKIDELAAFDEDAVQQEKFRELDDGDHTDAHQDIASQHASDKYEQRYRAAEDVVKALSPKLSAVVESLEELL